MIELVQSVLYGVECVLGVIVWGGTADKLDTPRGCYFGKQSSCSFIIFISVVAWIMLCSILVSRLLQQLITKFEFVAAWELRILFAMSAMWGLVALVASIASPGLFRTSTGNTVVTFSWINVILHCVSTGIVYFNNRHEPSDDSVA